MAVKFANLFMAKFETEMLADYETKFKKLPTVWLRYIDDIFFTWDCDETSLKHFINFCNNYSSNQNMKSNITFTADYSTSEVYFLDTKIKSKVERLISQLYSKPTGSFQYLHRTSYHPPHTFRSILKSQFIRHSITRFYLSPHSPPTFEVVLTRFGSLISPYVPLGHQSGSALWLQLCNIWTS